MENRAGIPVDLALAGIDTKYYSMLNMEGFSNMMSNPSYCYKFYWLEAIVKLITESRTETTFDEIINEMIVNAWYSVTEFHIHLSGFVKGEPRDGLERAVVKLGELSGLDSQCTNTEIRNALHEFSKELKAEKTQLTNMVPYRALAGFFYQAKEKPDWKSVPRMVNYIQHFNQSYHKLPYTLGTSSGLQKEVYINPDWAQMIKDNATAILGWIQYEKVKWLQANNPEVPGLVYKLAPMSMERKLQQVQKLWNAVIAIHPVYDVFTDKPIQTGKFDVDHFIPWSFVMNDELWNLSPMESTLNSSKSNNLPDWDRFFKRFANTQYLLYEKMNSIEQIRNLFNACYKYNLHSIWASEELYRQGNKQSEFIAILEKNMRPIYDSAKRQGYRMWAFSG